MSNNKLECRPVLLPGAKTPILLSDIGSLHISQLNIGNHHLYLVSDREIKKGDWFLSDDRDRVLESPIYRVEKCIEVKNGWLYGNILGTDLGYNSTYSKKIEAATDLSLELSDIPTNWIEEFVFKQGKIDKVYIKMYKGPIDYEYHFVYKGGENQNEVIILPTAENQNVGAFDYIEASKKHYDTPTEYLHAPHLRKRTHLDC